MIMKIFATLVLLIAGQTIVYCQASVPRVTSDDHPALPGHGLSPLIDWLNEPWESGDAPYAVLRSQVEDAENQGTLGALISDSESAYKSKPSDLKIQFKYFYALWLNRWENDVDYSEAETDDMFGFESSLMRPGMQRPSLPRTYNYTRLAALCADIWVFEPTLLPFLERLIQEDHNDLEATYYLPCLLAASNKPPLQARAIDLANALTVKYPRLATVYVCQGYAYYMAWLNTKNPIFAQKAEDGYRAYLKLTIPNGSFRLTAENVIRQVEKVQAASHRPVLPGER